METKIITALARLIDAADCRDNTMGDQCRLFEVKAELSAASRNAKEALREYRDSLQRDILNIQRDAVAAVKRATAAIKIRKPRNVPGESDWSFILYHSTTNRPDRDIVWVGQLDGYYAVECAVDNKELVKRALKKIIRGWTTWAQDDASTVLFNRLISEKYTVEQLTHRLLEELEAP